MQASTSHPARYRRRIDHQPEFEASNWCNQQGSPTAPLSGAFSSQRTRQAASSHLLSINASSESSVPLDGIHSSFSSSSDLSIHAMGPSTYSEWSQQSVPFQDQYLPLGTCLSEENMITSPYLSMGERPVYYLTSTVDDSLHGFMPSSMGQSLEYGPPCFDPTPYNDSNAALVCGNDLVGTIGPIIMSDTHLPVDALNHLALGEVESPLCNFGSPLPQLGFDTYNTATPQPVDFLSFNESAVSSPATFGGSASSFTSEIAPYSPATTPSSSGGSSSSRSLKTRKEKQHRQKNKKVARTIVKHIKTLNGGQVELVEERAHSHTHSHAKHRECNHRDNDGNPCPYQTKRPEHFTRHGLKHDDYRPYFCPLDDYRFKRSDNACDHLKTHLTSTLRPRHKRCTWQVLRAAMIVALKDEPDVLKRQIANIERWIKKGRQQTR